MSGSPGRGAPGRGEPVGGPVRGPVRGSVPTPTSRAVGWLAERAARLTGATATDVPGPDGAVLRVCASAGRGVCARGGTTYGEVFVTRRPLARVGPALVRHELVHVRQWRRLGLLLPLLYALSGADPLRNRFEQQAGLRDGGYLR